MLKNKELVVSTMRLHVSAPRWDEEVSAAVLHDDLLDDILQWFYSGALWYGISRLVPFPLEPVLAQKIDKNCLMIFGKQGIAQVYNSKLKLTKAFYYVFKPWFKNFSFKIIHKHLVICMQVE